MSSSPEKDFPSLEDIVNGERPRDSFSFNPKEELQKPKEKEGGTAFSFNPMEKLRSKKKSVPKEQGAGSPLDDTTKGAALKECFENRNTDDNENEKEESNFVMGEQISSEQAYDPNTPPQGSVTTEVPGKEQGAGSPLDDTEKGAGLRAGFENRNTDDKEGEVENTQGEVGDGTVEKDRLEPLTDMEDLREKAERQEDVKKALEEMQRRDEEKLAQKEKEGWNVGRRFGEWWKKGCPKWVKRGLAAAAVGSAVVGTFTGFPAFFAPAIVGRVLTGSALYATFEGAFEKYAKKKGEGVDQRSTVKKNVHTLVSAGGGVVATVLLGRLFGELLSGVGDGASSAVEGLLGNTSNIPVEEGDTVWDIIKEKLSGQSTFDAMGAEQQTHVVDALKDRVEAMNPGQLQAVGIESGDPDMIFPGDTLDLSSVLNDGNVNTAYQDALNLSQAEIDSIAQNLQNK